MGKRQQNSLERNVCCLLDCRVSVGGVTKLMGNVRSWPIAGREQGRSAPSMGPAFQADGANSRTPCFHL